LYAQRHVAKVAGLVLRGAFLARRRDLDWFIGEDGVRRIYPDGWAQFIDCMPIDERDDPMEALHKRLTGADELAQLRAARDWSRWTGQVTLGEDFVGEDADNRNSTSAVNRVRIEVHYAKNGYFITENEVLEQCGKLARLPAIIVHGRRDLVCPAESAYLLHRALPGSDLRVLPKAGHIADGEEMIDALVNAADEMAQRLAA
jgi:proline iminopeptidase